MTCDRCDQPLGPYDTAICARCAFTCTVCQSTELPLNDDGWCRWCVEAERCETPELQESR